MQAKGHPLQDFDLVVQTFAEAVGFAVLPAVLDVAPPVADSVGEYSGRFYTSIPEIGNRRSDVKETALPF